MCENNGYLTANVNPASAVELFDSGGALEGTSKVWIVFKKYIV